LTGAAGAIRDVRGFARVAGHPMPRPFDAPQVLAARSVQSMVVPK